MNPLIDAREVLGSVRINSRRGTGLAVAAAIVLAAVSIFFFSSIPVRPAHAATITVNTAVDNLTSGDGSCTLREAIRNANSDSDTTGGDCAAGSGADTIDVPMGVYTLAIAGKNEQAAATGDLDITDDLTIVGVGANGLGTVISGAFGVDRVFEITRIFPDPFPPVGIRDVQIKGGDPIAGLSGGQGGAIMNRGTLTLSNIELISNRALEGGGV